jgi:hypothetical protein
VLHVENVIACSWGVLGDRGVVDWEIYPKIGRVKAEELFEVETGVAPPQSLFNTCFSWETIQFP